MTNKLTFYFKNCLLFIFVGLLLSCSERKVKNEADNKHQEEFLTNILKAQKITNGNKSLPFSLKAYEIAKNSGNKKDAATALIEVSHDYERLGNLRLALKYTLEAAGIYQEDNDLENLAVTNNRIGSVYLSLEDTCLSLKYLEKALLYNKKNSHDNLAGYDLNNIGEIYRLSGKYPEAKSYFNEALTYFTPTEDSLEYAYTIGNLGLVESATGNFSLANQYLEKASKVLYKLGDYYPITVYLTENAKILFEQGRYKEAIDKLNTSLVYSQREGLREQTVQTYKLLSEIYSSRNHYKNAFKYYQLYTALNDSLINLDVVRKMESQRTDFEITKRETVIENLQHINKLRNIIILILTLSIIAITILAFSMFRLLRKIKGMNSLLLRNASELENKKKNLEKALVEKEALNKEIHHRVKNNLQVVSSLLSLQSRRFKDKDTIAAIEDSRNRIETISLIHQKLYQSENMAFVKAPEYIRQLIEAIHRTYSGENLKIKHILDIENLYFDIDTAVPLGLIINELAINAYKYAFTESNTGTIHLETRLLSNSCCSFMFKDNGKGLPSGFNLKSTNSLGIKLINILSGQLNGKAEFYSNGGVEFCLNFEPKLYQTSK